jgi:hypothetical protein
MLQTIARLRVVANTRAKVFAYRKVLVVIYQLLVIWRLALFYCRAHDHSVSLVVGQIILGKISVVYHLLFD